MIAAIEVFENFPGLLNHTLVL